MRNPAKPVVTAEIEHSRDRHTWIRVEVEDHPVVQGFVVPTGLEVTQYVEKEARDAIAAIDGLRAFWADHLGKELTPDLGMALSIAVHTALQRAGVVDSDGKPVKR